MSELRRKLHSNTSIKERKESALFLSQSLDSTEGEKCHIMECLMENVPLFLEPQLRPEAEDIG
jgi:hypothetical protein